MTYFLQYCFFSKDFFSRSWRSWRSIFDWTFLKSFKERFVL